MSGASYLTAAEIAGIQSERLNALATFTAFNPLSLALYRPNDATGADDAIPAQTVLWKLRKDRAPRLAGGEGAESQQADGTFRKELPFDVQVGDRFKLPNGRKGTITMVPLARGGALRAYFTIDEGTP